MDRQHTGCGRCRGEVFKEIVLSSRVGVNTQRLLEISSEFSTRPSIEEKPHVGVAQGLAH